MTCKTYLFINSSFDHTKTESRTKKSKKHSSHTITLSKSTIFAKNGDISKIKEVLVLKGKNAFLKTLTLNENF